MSGHASAATWVVAVSGMAAFPLAGLYAFPQGQRRSVRALTFVVLAAGLSVVSTVASIHDPGRLPIYAAVTWPIVAGALVQGPAPAALPSRGDPRRKTDPAFASFMARRKWVALTIYGGWAAFAILIAKGWL